MSEQDISSPQDAPGSVPVPNTIQVFNVFNQFFIRWANQETKYVPMQMDEISPLHLEQGIYFFEPFEGILVIRTRDNFERFITDLSKTKKEDKNPHTKGLFLEMVVLFWHLFVSQVWRLDTRTTKPAMLKTSIPADWPDRRPDTACTLFIKDVPLEIRLWTRVTADEAKAWKKTLPRQ